MPGPVEVSLVIPVDAADRWRGARGACAWLAVLAAVLLRFHPLLSPDATFPHHDWYQVHEVDAEHVVQAVHDGSLVPLWSPWLMCGTPLYAVATKPLSYPPFLLAVALLGGTAGMNVLALGHVLLAAAGMLRLGRRLGCGPSASAAAAILLVTATWPGSLFKSQPFWGYAVAYWPWALRAALDVLDAPERRALLPAALRLGVFMALQVLAGGVFQVYWLSCFLLAFSLPFLLRRGDVVGRGRRSAALLLAAAVALLLAAVRVWPALRWMESTGRSAALRDEEILSGYAEDISAAGGARLALAVLRELLLRDDRFGTWSLLAGCALGLLFARRRRIAWAAAAGVAVCVVIATGLFHDQLVLWLPGYDRMRLPYRFLAAAGLGAAALTALGIDGLLLRLPRAAAAVVLVLGVPLLLLDVALLPGWRWVSPFTSSMSELRAMAEPVLSVLDDGARGRFLSPTERFQSLWVQRGLRSTAGVLGGTGAANLAFTEWLPPDSSPLELEALRRGVLDVLAVRYTTSFERLDVPWLTPVFEPRDPRAAARAAQAAPRSLDPYEAYLMRTRRQPDGEAYQRPFVYRRAGALPHAALVERVVLVVGAAAARTAALHEALERRSFDASATVYVEDPDVDPAALAPDGLAGLAGVLFSDANDRAPGPRALVERAGGRLSARRGGGVLWEPDEPRPAGFSALDEALVDARCNATVVELPVPAAPLLLLSETYVLHPGWTARIDGQPADLLRADGCITALRLPPGARRVELTYRPPGLLAGMLLSTATLLLLGGVVLWRRRRG